jgi:YbbR domain-containing protein
MNWTLVTDEWRLKLLAVGLAVLMLGTLAFSQNQPTTNHLDVGLNYTVPPNIILINPPAKTTVFYSGLAAVISRVNDSNLIASVDATRALPGSAVKLNVAAKSLISDVLVQTPPPIAVTVDTLQKVEVPVQVNARAAPGWSIDPTKTVATCPAGQGISPCKAHFTGPVSWENNLRAVTTVPGLVIGKNDYLNQPVQLQNGTSNLDLSVRTVPLPSIDVTSVDIHVEAFAGTTSASVPLIDTQPSHPPPPGYRVTGVTITPLLVTISGDPAVLVRIRNIPLPAMDLSNRTSDATFQVQVPYPTGVTGEAQTATVRFSISANPNVSPSPGP